MNDSTESEPFAYRAARLSLACSLFLPVLVWWGFRSLKEGEFSTFEMILNIAACGFTILLGGLGACFALSGVRQYGSNYLLWRGLLGLVLCGGLGAFVVYCAVQQFRQSDENNLAAAPAAPAAATPRQTSHQTDAIDALPLADPGRETAKLQFASAADDSHLGASASSVTLGGPNSATDSENENEVSVSMLDAPVSAPPAEDALTLPDLHVTGISDSVRHPAAILRSGDRNFTIFQGDTFSVKTEDGKLDLEVVRISDGHVQLRPPGSAQLVELSLPGM